MEGLIDFLKLNYFIIVYGITWIISMKMYGKYFDTALKYFPMLIAYAFFNELLGYFIRYSDKFAFFENTTDANQLIYNIYIVIFFSYVYGVYWVVIKRVRFKKYVLAIAGIVLLGYCWNSYYVDPLVTDLIYANGVGSIGLILCIILYFSQLDPKFNWKWDKYNLMFWFSAGLFVFYLFFPILFLIGYTRFDIWEQFHLKTVLRFLIVLMYTLFATGFIMCRRRIFR